MAEIEISYDLNQIRSYRGKNAAFRDWIYKLQRGEQLPRGKFFKGKKPGSPHYVMDEAWMILNPRIGQAS